MPSLRLRGLLLAGLAACGLAFAPAPASVLRRRRGGSAVAAKPRPAEISQDEWAAEVKKNSAEFEDLENANAPWLRGSDGATSALQTSRRANENLLKVRG